MKLYGSRRSLSGGEDCGVSNPRRSPFPALALMLALAALAALGAGCKASSGSPALKISGGDPVLYDCGGGARITARYYSLSDGSLSFVKLEMPDGAKFTLPNLASASGARYSDDMNLVWWTKGNGAFAEKRDDSGQWKTIYPDCREIEKGAK